MRLPKGIDRSQLQNYLSEEQFEAAFHMSQEKFDTLPLWKKTNLKKYRKTPVTINKIPVKIEPQDEPTRFLGVQLRSDLSSASQISKMKQQRSTPTFESLTSN